MQGTNKRWLILAGAMALAAAAFSVVRRPAPTDPAADDDRGRSARNYPLNGSGSDVKRAVRNDGDATSAAATVPPAADPAVEDVLEAWRRGILLKDADAVVAADAVFRRDPQRFRGALMTSAETDAEERVRAFSTRVLGKMVDPACAPLLTRLLEDQSSYVRLNAAWALGELAATPAGHAAAAPALDALRSLARRETAQDTRKAAALAVRRLL